MVTAHLLPGPCQFCLFQEVGNWMKILCTKSFWYMWRFCEVTMTTDRGSGFWGHSAYINCRTKQVSRNYSWDNCRGQMKIVNTRSWSAVFDTQSYSILTVFLPFVAASNAAALFHEFFAQVVCNCSSGWCLQRTHRYYIASKPKLQLASMVFEAANQVSSLPNTTPSVKGFHFSGPDFQNWVISIKGAVCYITWAILEISFILHVTQMMCQIKSNSIQCRVRILINCSVDKCCTW